MANRNTSQQAAVRTALLESRSPLDAHALLAAARVHAPRLGMATVYRVVARLMEEGVCKPVRLPGQCTRFEWVHEGHHHHYFACNGCGTVYAIEGCLDDLECLLPPSFSLEEHEVVLYGKCRACVTTRSHASPLVGLRHGGSGTAQPLPRQNPSSPTPGQAKKAPTL